MKKDASYESPNQQIRRLSGHQKNGIHQFNFEKYFTAITTAIATQKIIVRTIFQIITSNRSAQNQFLQFEMYL